MPSQFGTATVITERSYDITWLTGGGDKPHTRINEVPTAVTDANLNTLRDALGALSNAGIRADNRTTKREISVGAVEAFDEMYADARTRLTLLFENDALDLKEINIPAPDASYFGGDGITAITPGLTADSPELLLSNAIAAILTVINTGGGTYAYIAGYRSPLPAGFRVRALPNLGEPEEGDFPMDLPAIGGE